MSDDRIRDEWLQITDKLRRRWRKLTAEDVLCPDGSSDYLARLLQERYGVDWNEAVLQVTEFESELWPDAQDG